VLGDELRASSTEHSVGYGPRSWWFRGVVREKWTGTSLSYLTFTELQAQKDVLWAESISQDRDGADVLLFHTMDELASTLDAFIPADLLLEAASKALLVLKTGIDWLEDQGQLPPYSCVYLLNKLARLVAGLDPEG
jgi:hypothetical protein